ncbi:GST protein [Aphelenchoides bicaudatus]|nr:GST protein [Aphelenchoides bicaudatus]
MSHKYKVIGFRFRGLGEIARLILEYSNTPYENLRLEKEEWESMKPNVLFHQLPILEVDGKQLHQSCAIGRYLAKQFNLAGRDDFEAAQVDGVADFQKEVWTALTPYLSVAFGYSEGDLKALEASCLVPTLPNYMPLYEQILKESGSGFFVASGVTWVDFYVSEFFLNLQNYAPNVIGEYKFVAEYLERVHNLPQIKEYIKNRPKTSH